MTTGGLNELKSILAAKDRNEVERICKSVSISLESIPSLIACLKSDGWTHRFFSHEHCTENISFSEKNRSEIEDTTKIPSAKTLGKMTNMFDSQERKMFFGHLFEKGDQWHLFHFSGASLEGNESGKFWGTKPHAHYLSSKHGLKSVDVLKALEKNGKGLSGEHVAIS